VLTVLYVVENILFFLYRKFNYVQQWPFVISLQATRNFTRIQRFEQPSSMCNYWGSFICVQNNKFLCAYEYTEGYKNSFFKQFILKELSVKPDIEPIPWLSMLAICEQSLCDTRNTPQKLLVLQNNNSPLFNASPAPVFPASENNALLSLSEKPPSVNHPHSGGPYLFASPPPPPPSSSLKEKRFGSMIAQSPATVIGSSEKPPLTAKPHITTVVSKDLTSQHESKNVKLPPTAVVKYSIPKVHSSDKVTYPPT
jgi:hypothetical protein